MAERYKAIRRIRFEKSWVEGHILYRGISIKLHSQCDNGHCFAIKEYVHT